MIDDWSHLRRILCVRLDNMGDVVMTSPALTAIKHTAPEARITLLGSASGTAVTRMMPVIDDIIAHAAPWVKSHAPSSPMADWQLIARLQRCDFDAAVIFTTYSQSPLPAAMLCRLAEIPRRLAHCRENPYDLLTHWIRETEPQNGFRHEVRRQLDLVSQVGFTTRDERMQVKTSASAQAEARRLLHEHEWSSDGPLVVVHPGASAASRRYPGFMFAEALRLLARRRHIRVVVTGSMDESPLAEEIRAARVCECLCLAGALELEVFTALLGEADLLISNNTGPVHLAAALGTPVVDLYALTNPQHTPWMAPCRVLSHEVPCKHCHKSVCPEGHHECLRGVAPLAVAAAAEELLNGQPPTPATSFTSTPVLT